MVLKEKIKQYKYSGNLIKKLIFYALKLFWIIIKLITDARMRAEFFAKRKNSKNQYQISTFTKNNRYPLLFWQCTQYLKNIASPRILSFGCSTGEEVRTLGKYMPYAIIYGTDINKWCIQQCNKNNKTSRHFFYHSFLKELEDLKELDAIFCMAVFQKTENRINKNNDTFTGFSFTQFENEIILLDSKLKQNGLFIVDHTDFSFTDTVVASRYAPLDFEHNQLLRKRPLFNRDNIKIADKHCSYRVFVKICHSERSEGTAELR